MSEQTGPPAEPAKPHHQSFWLWVMCLTGVDYFSTLGYQPSIAYENAGLLAPFATIVLVLVTLFGALPIYWYVCGRSHTGQGSIGMLARLVSGWPGKILVLVLLGFAATDFVITKTLSAADAAVHLIQNPHWPCRPPDDAETTRQAIYVTSFLLLLLGASFMRGFREVIGLAVVIVTVYIILSAVVVGAGVVLPRRAPGVLLELATARRERGVASEGIAARRFGLANRRGDQPHHLPETGTRSVRVRDRRCGDAAREGKRERRPDGTEGPHSEHAEALAHRRADHVGVPDRLVGRCRVPGSAGAAHASPTRTGTTDRESKTRI